MRIETNGRIIESDDVLMAINAAFSVFDGETIVPPDLETIRAWALTALIDLQQAKRASAGITESMYHEAKRWQVQPNTPLSLDTGRKSAADYAGWVVTTWDKIEVDSRLGVLLVNQAVDVDTIAVILSRRF